MNRDSPRSLYSRFRTTSLATLLSRVLGMVRDVAMAAMLGLSSSPAMDAFVMAFRLPDLFRRLFAEGGLTASFLPVLTNELKRDRGRAFQLATSVLAIVALMALAGVLIGEGLCAVAFSIGADSLHPSSHLLLIQLTAILLPYVLLVCITAQLAAVLNALDNFASAALAPAVLNICWLCGVFVAISVTDLQELQVRILAVFILIAGVLQVALQASTLWYLGFRLSWNWGGTRELVIRVFQSMLPALLGLSVTQINTVADTIMAWGLSLESLVSAVSSSRNALEQGAASAVYYSERLYMFPVGLIGLATATAIFPSIAGKAADRDLHGMSRELTRGLMLIGFFAIPAGAGLILLAEPIVSVLLQRGAFTFSDTARTAIMIRAYAIGVWGFCALPVMIRGFYANSDVRSPARIGAVCIATNIVLSILLSAFIGESGLALATSIVATAQMLVLMAVFSSRHTALHFSVFWGSTFRTVVATLIMIAIGMGVLWVTEGRIHPAIRLGMCITACVACYLFSAWLIGGAGLFKSVDEMTSRDGPPE